LTIAGRIITFVVVMTPKCNFYDIISCLQLKLPLSTLGERKADVFFFFLLLIEKNHNRQYSIIIKRLI